MNAVLALGADRRLSRVRDAVFAAVLTVAALVPNGWGWMMARGVPGRLAYRGTVAAARIAALMSGGVGVAALLWRAAVSKANVLGDQAVLARREPADEVAS